MTPLETAVLDRRTFLRVASGFGAAVVAGCATNPVTGERQLMLISEAQELDMDRKWAAHQISSDYGPMQDAGMQAYVAEVGNRLASLTHRPGMPYSFRVVNHVVVNGYTLPAGSVALTRGLMLAMENEAQLAAVLGHELAHVNARHAATRMTNSLLLMGLMAGVSAYAEREQAKYKDLAAGLGALGANMLLSHYSRDDEREADRLGMDYMTRAGYDPGGMAGLMETFMKLRDGRPNAVELLFATHPMSDERYETAVRRAATRYAGAGGRIGRERYMDETAGLRAIGPAILAMQQGQKNMMSERYAEAESDFRDALARVPDDYAGLLMMAKCYLAREQYNGARRYAEQAHAVYPEEPQARHLLGMAELGAGAPGDALAQFQAYQAALPGNANVLFYEGLCHERMGARQKAVAVYRQYAAAAPQGEFAGYIQSRLVEWNEIPVVNEQAR